MNNDFDGTGGTRCGYVALIGAPNAGKSTLLNALLKTKLSIVSPKAQTTRARITGIATEDKTQIVFLDTPGMLPARRHLEKAMVQAVREAITDADVVVVVLDIARRGWEQQLKDIAVVLAQLEIAGCWLALNKIDGTARVKLLDIATRATQIIPCDKVFMISALKENGTADLFRALAREMPKGPFLFPEDQLTDLRDRQLAEELTREQLFRMLHDEIPYGLTVETESYEENADGTITIRQLILIAQDSHRKIILGHGGEMIRTVGEKARGVMANMFECPVHLFLHVKVDERWQQDPLYYEKWGLAPPS